MNAPFPDFGHRVATSILMAIVVTAGTGCLVPSSMIAPLSLSPPPGVSEKGVVEPCSLSPDDLEQAASKPDWQDLAEALLERGRLCDQEEQAVAVDYYASAAMLIYPNLSARIAGNNTPDQSLVQQYNEALAGFLSNAIRHDRFHGRELIRIQLAGKWYRVENVFENTRWTRDDFDQLFLARDYESAKLKRYWSMDGVGLAVIGMRHREPGESWLGSFIPFSSTAVLSASESDLEPVAQVSYHDEDIDEPIIAQLQFLDPLSTDTVAMDSTVAPITRDFSAPMALVKKEISRDSLKNFLLTEREDEAAGLRLVEPYSPGRIPVIFVHGLLSDKFTWIDMVNDLRAIPEFNDRYQIWSFQYHTGDPFLRAGLDLRSSLQQIVNELDPDGNDPRASTNGAGRAQHGRAGLQTADFIQWHRTVGCVCQQGL